MKRVLELFSGTHSVGKVFHKNDYEVYSLDRDLGAQCPLGEDYKSEHHFQEDIMTWDYKQFPSGYFSIITASPVCLWWSTVRQSWIGRKCKSIHPTDVITKKILQDDIDKYGKPMVDKVIEIIEYFQPKYWWIENPQTGKMKYYIEEKYPKYNTYYDFDYCKYSDWGYRKRTRFWTNIKGIDAKKCNKDCGNIITIKSQKGDKRGQQIIKADTRTLHIKSFGSNNRNQKCVGGGIDRLQRYRIPKKLIEDFVEKIKQCE